MNKTLMTAVMAAALLGTTGCESVKKTAVDFGFLSPELKVCEEGKDYTCPVMEEAVDTANIIADKLNLDIKPTNLVMNHYINEVLTDEDYDSILNSYTDGNASTFLNLHMPATNGGQVEHILIIKFTQN